MTDEFEMAAKVRNLFESQIEGYFLDRHAFREHVLSRPDSAFIEPALRRAPEVPSEFPLKMA